MFSDSDDWLWWFKTLAFVALAMIGGMLGYIMRTLDDAGTPIKYQRVIVEGIASGFVGLLVMFLCNVMGMSDQWTGIVVGVMGWMGARVSMMVLEYKVLNQLGLRNKNSDIVAKEEPDA